jgi:magnesium chelatase subunit D
LRAAALNVVLIDTSPRPQPLAAQLAEAMGARYLALPHADALAVSAAVRLTQAV